MNSSDKGQLLPGSARLGAPGTLPWLLISQIRVSWRSLKLSRGVRVFMLIALVVLVGAALVAAPAMWRVRGALATISTLSGTGLLWAVGATLFVFLLLVSGAISATLEALYERGDLDLLLGAPIRPRLVLASRLLGVAVSAGLLYALLSVPVLVFALAAGLWRFLGLIPWLVSLALLAASVGGLLTLGLVRWLGVRRARTMASVVGALSGAGFFLVSQLPTMLGRRASVGSTPAGAALLAPFQQLLQGSGPLGQASPLWFPARALWLEPLPTLTLLAGALLVFALSARLLEGAFQRGAQQAGMHGQARPVAQRERGPLRFREGTLALLGKEWRLLARDPLLLSRILLQLVYLLPLAFVVLNNGGAGTAGTLIGGAGILALGSLAGNLAMITTNAEDAPELLMSAPQRPQRLRVVKLWAAVLPVLTLWLLLTLAALWRTPGLSALLGAALGLWSVMGSALIVLWRPMEVRRADLFRRGQRADLLMSLTTLLMQGGLLLALFMLVRVPLLGVFGLLLALIGPGIALSIRPVNR